MNKHSYTSGFAALPLIIILAIIVVGGGAYMYRNTTPVQPVATTPSEEAQVPQKQNPAPIQNTKGEIFSLTITPSTKDQIWTTYRSGAKAIVKSKNLKSIAVFYYPTGTEIKKISVAGIMESVSGSSPEQTWELVLPPSLLTTQFWAEGIDLMGQSIKSADLGNVGYEE